MNRKFDARDLDDTTKSLSSLRDAEQIRTCGAARLRVPQLPAGMPHHQAAPHIRANPDTPKSKIPDSLEGGVRPKSSILKVPRPETAELLFLSGGAHGNNNKPASPTRTLARLLKRSLLAPLIRTLCFVAAKWESFRLFG